MHHTHCDVIEPLWHHSTIQCLFWQHMWCFTTYSSIFQQHNNISLETIVNCHWTNPPPQSILNLLLGIMTKSMKTQLVSDIVNTLPSISNLLLGIMTKCEHTTIYSETCNNRLPHRTTKSGLIWQVVFHCRQLLQKYRAMLLQKWSLVCGRSLMAVVSHGRFHCIPNLLSGIMTKYEQTTIYTKTSILFYLYNIEQYINCHDYYCPFSCLQQL